ncbi:MAG: hypothetical protein BWY80_01402 [Firmicutes bacterium ADurb.Bin456]|nr:MAG: hypothetical protein BWY80_01402 [Firmicutes bacterium ADurb.Bin456]
MRSIEGRLKAIENRMPKRNTGDFEIWLEQEDGTVTGDGGRIVSQEEQDAAAASGDLIILGGEEDIT